MHRNRGPVLRVSSLPRAHLLTARGAFGPLLAAVMLVLGSGCGGGGDARPDGGTMDPCPPAPASCAPVLIEATQSATNVHAGETVTLHVAARSDAGRPLHFAWDASSHGTFDAALDTGTTSDVSWTAPACQPATTVVTLTLTVTDDANHSASRDFHLSVRQCPAPGVSGGKYHSLFGRADGTVWASGSNFSGVLGDGTKTTRPTPVQVSGLTGATAVAASAHHSLAARGDGTVWAWGDNSWSELGDGTTNQHLTAVQVPGLTGVTAVAAGYSFSLALRGEGTVWGWGMNANGQLGDGKSDTRRTPQQVPGLSEIVAIAAGGNHSLALHRDGTVWVWGDNMEGQLGLGQRPSRSTPVPLPSLTNVIAIAAGEYHSLAVRGDGTVWAWGSNTEGQVGDASTPEERYTPFQVPGLSGAAAVAAGQTHSLALLQDGTVRGWGDNSTGQLGDGTNTPRETPVPLSGLTGVISLVAGSTHSLALLQDGTVRGWGYNGTGQLGDGTTDDRSRPIPPSLP